jgi:hypothetical protein
MNEERVRARCLSQRRTDPILISQLTLRIPKSSANDPKSAHPAR